MAHESDESHCPNDETNTQADCGLVCLTCGSGFLCVRCILYIGPVSLSLSRCVMRMPHVHTIIKKHSYVSFFLFPFRPSPYSNSPPLTFIVTLFIALLPLCPPCPVHSNRLLIFHLLTKRPLLLPFTHDIRCLLTAWGSSARQHISHTHKGQLCWSAAV